MKQIKAAFLESESQKIQCKRNKITEAEKRQMKPMLEQLGHGHGSPKSIEVFTNIPKFWSITDSTNTSYYKIGLYLPSLIKPITIYT